MLQAQEKAGIFVDDAHLFEQPLSAGGRRLQQADAVSQSLQVYEHHGYDIYQGRTSIHFFLSGRQS